MARCPQTPLSAAATMLSAPFSPRRARASTSPAASTWTWRRESGGPGGVGVLVGRRAGFGGGCRGAGGAVRPPHSHTTLHPCPPTPAAHRHRRSPHRRVPPAVPPRAADLRQGGRGQQLCARALHDRQGDRGPGPGPHPQAGRQLHRSARVPGVQRRRRRYRVGPGVAAARTPERRLWQKVQAGVHRLPFAPGERQGARWVGVVECGTGWLGRDGVGGWVAGAAAWFVWQPSARPFPPSHPTSDHPTNPLCRCRPRWWSLTTRSCPPTPCWSTPTSPSCSTTRRCTTFAAAPWTSSAPPTPT